MENTMDPASRISTIPAPRAADTSVAPESGVYLVPDGRARQVLLAAALDAVHQVRDVHIRRTVAVTGDYRQTEGWSLPQAGSPEEAYADLRTRAYLIAEQYPAIAAELGAAAEALAPVVDPTLDVEAVWGCFLRSMDRLAQRLGLGRQLDRPCRVTATATHLVAALPGTAGDRGAGGPHRPVAASDFLIAVGAIQRKARREGSRPTVAQFVVEHVAADLLARGTRVTGPSVGWGTSGFRRYQTYMSVTDPGEGHLQGTLRDHRYLRGVIVHIEHLERGAHQSRTEVEPYRMPHPLVIARVRLALGADAPSSSYVGRPVFEHDVDNGMLKAVHTVAAACSELFAEGLTECKIAIEGLTASQAVTYMRGLRAAVRRDPHTQLLSAAFNLNTPLVDDRRGRRLVGTAPDSRLARGMLGIELTSEAGFDKVTWDGTSDSYPSGCVLEQISPEEAVTLVHEAHEVGLLTYFSAGFRFEHLPAAVETGVDGVGVGGAQILRYMDRTTGNHGPFLPANIARILAVRDDAERGLRGRAAALLSRLDRMHYELSIDVRDEMRRQALFDHLRRGATDGELEAVVQQLSAVERLEVDRDHPLVCWARRLERAGSRSLLARIVEDWPAVVRRLSSAADAGDLDHLAVRLRDLRRHLTTGEAAA